MENQMFNTYKQYVNDQAIKYIQQHPTMKMGQVIYTIVKQDFPILIKRIKFTNMDPYDNDDNITKFWEYIKIKYYS